MTRDEIILRLCSGQVSAISPSASSGWALKPSAISSRSFGDIEESVKRYFDGERVDFNFPLDLPYSTAFQRSVYKITKTIPYGEVKSYKWVAKKMGLPDASRAVGGALSRNPIPLLIPCHRVVREDGGMGGFTAHGGIDLKTKMLKMERAFVIPNEMRNL